MYPATPATGKKHPLIIWVVGGWGNGIDEFPWSYAEWDNDQSASAFWEAGVLTMYPSFRGGNGNPGYYETLFGEVDDIAAAYEYAASLPYVDPARIYLGGHSTGGTRALLATEYINKFRATFCFGAVDKVKFHNNEQFTFDTSNKKESILRSPLFWLEHIETPTFIIEGIDGNSPNVKNMQKESKNKNISCYIIDDADHFSVLAPITELLAQKILKDTGEKTNITLTQEELQAAMAQPPKEPMPILIPYQEKSLGLSFFYPFVWEIQDQSDNKEFLLSMQSSSNEDNIWDMFGAFVNAFILDEGTDYIQKSREYLQDASYTIKDVDINGFTAIEANGVSIEKDGSRFSNKVLLIEKTDFYIEFNFFIHEDFKDTAEPLFQTIVDSVVLN